MKAITAITCLSLGTFAQETWKPLPAYANTRPAAAMRVLDLDASPGEELVLVAFDGTVEVLGWDPEAGGLARRGAPLQLASPRSSLLQLVDLMQTGRPQLIVLSDAGARAHALGADGGFEAEGHSLARRARISLRLPQPTFADFVRDLDADGDLDLVVPTLRSCELWFRSEDSGERQGGQVLRKGAEVPVDVSSSTGVRTEELSDRMVSGVSIPDLSTRDVNGDQRPDLLVVEDEQRSFHLQRPDGSYPEEPDVSVDLTIFTDATAKEGFAMGEIVSNSDRLYDSRDLNADGIPDYVIGHRRKIWVFHGSERGPQFTEPVTILRVADDVSLMSLFELDDDGAIDLFLAKVEAPTTSALILGLLTSWEVEVRILGYRNVDGRFETTPTWRRELELELPPILDLVRDSDTYFERFEAVGEQFVVPVQGDFDGDGDPDLLVYRAETDMLDYWLRNEDGEDFDEERYLRDLLLMGETSRFDLDAILTSVSGMADERLRSLTAGRPATGKLALRPEAESLYLGALAVDLTGDGVDELLCLYEDLSAERRLQLDGWRLSRP